MNTLFSSIDNPGGGGGFLAAGAGGPEPPGPAKTLIIPNRKMIKKYNVFDLIFIGLKNSKFTEIKKSIKS